MIQLLQQTTICYVTEPVNHVTVNVTASKHFVIQILGAREGIQCQAIWGFTNPRKGPGAPAGVLLKYFLSMQSMNRKGEWKKIQNIF